MQVDDPLRLWNMTVQGKPRKRHTTMTLSGLLLDKYRKPGEPETLIPKITQETLAEMIGTTRSRVSFFMNRFRDLGFIEYNGAIKVHKSLLNVILHD
jgi:hypothetical protein